MQSFLPLFVFLDSSELLQLLPVLRVVWALSGQVVAEV